MKCITKVDNANIIIVLMFLILLFLFCRVNRSPLLYIVPLHLRRLHKYFFSLYKILYISDIGYVAQSAGVPGAAPFFFIPLKVEEEEEGLVCITGEYINNRGTAFVTPESELRGSPLVRFSGSVDL